MAQGKALKGGIAVPNSTVVRTCWHKIVDWLKQNNPRMLNSLNQPAKFSELKNFENRIGEELPDSFAELYSMHNGSADDCGIFIGLPWMSLARALEVKETWDNIADDEEIVEDFSEDIVSKPAGAVKTLYAHKRWVPFAGDAHNFLALDFDPDKHGSYGQVINAGRDDDTRHVVASSFEEFLKLLSRHFENGRVSIKKADAEQLVVSGTDESLLAALNTVLSGTAPASELIQPQAKSKQQMKHDDDGDDDELNEGDGTSALSDKRRFEFEEGNSSKFWEIQLGSRSLTTWWGKIGTAGQSKTLTFATDEEALKHYEKLVAEKTKKGYEEIDT